MSFVADLRWRGLLHQLTDPALETLLADGPETIYVGFDPTADSLHVGSLIPILALVRAQRARHRPIAVVGGATGMIGDPSGKSAERSLLDEAQVARNVAGIRSQLERFLDFSPSEKSGGAILVNNYDWTREMSYLGFLRDIGKLFSVNMMLGKDSVATRIEKQQGISYTEFSYMLLQAYDFLHLSRAHGCRVQLGGSDQWGNITGGIDLIRRLDAKEAYGLTMPLVTTSDGQKFGKTERGAVWLDSARTSPYELHQFFLNTDDRDVGRFLRFYTFLDEAAITALDETVRTAPEKREAQRVLAREVTTLVHGADEAGKAEAAARALFERKGGGELVVPPDAPSTMLASSELDGEGISIADLLVRTGLAASKGAARRDIEGGGIYLNDARIADANKRVTIVDLREGLLLLRKGKRSYHVVRLGS
jgi:tyrosyl-tRNA synthetase